VATPTGAVELKKPYDGDLELTPNGDLALLQDTFENAPATEQRVEHAAFTSPTPLNADGVAIGRPDDLFHPDYGAGLPQFLGEPFTPALVARIQAQMLMALARDPNVAQSPSPSVSVIELASGEIEVLTTCTDLLGQTRVFSSTRNRTGG
jgi:hypothetical protein